MRLRATSSAVFAGVTVTVLAFAGTAAMAQAVTGNATEEGAAAAAEMPTIDDAALAEALSPLSHTVAPARPLSLPRLKQQKSFDVSRTTSRPDGSGTVALKQALPAAWDSNIWDAKVGADLGVAGETHNTYDPRRPLAAPGKDGNAGAAWATIGIGTMASVDARIDPTNEQSRVAGTLKHSMPVGGHLSMTLQNSYSITDTFGAQTASALGGLPLVMPQDGSTAPSQVFGSERMMKLDVLSTGTSFAAALASASDDPVTHNKFSAEQKLLGPLSVTTAVSDVGQTVVNKSIRAGFKLNW